MPNLQEHQQNVKSLKKNHELKIGIVKKKRKNFGLKPPTLQLREKLLFV